MKACYIDESGHCGVKLNPDQPVEVLVGVLTDFYGLFLTQKEYEEILRILNEINISVSELKASHIYRGSKAWKNVKAETRKEVIEIILKWSVGRKCKYIVCPIDSSKFFKRKSGDCELAKKLHYPYEAGAFNILLAVQRLQKKEKNNKGKTLLVYDEQGEHDKRLLALLEDDLSFTDKYVGYELRPRSKKNPPRFGEIIDVPFFSKSHLSKTIQLADLAAFIVNKYLLLKSYKQPEKYEGELRIIEGWYNIIGEQLIQHTHINPTSKDDLSLFYKDIRPEGWSAKNWEI